MKKFSRIVVSIFLAAAFFFNSLPSGNACGPFYLTPVFDYEFAPENPFDDFARGKIGIVKPTYHRVVLFAAYRYLNGGAFTADEQKALVDVWQADFNNKDYADDDVSEAVKLWLERRKDVVDKEGKVPEIYTEREYGGYEFFPNCAKNAFETAAQTLADRTASYGADDANVKDWVAAQDAVFTNCASGKQTPEPANNAMPEWLQKDRAYQRAAAEFYALDYENARRDFAEIAQDADSVWRETADYLVVRTLIRQASLTSDEAKRNQFYAEAEARLANLSQSGGRFAASIEKYDGLIKYRLHPQERTNELAQKLSIGAGNENFRQDLIDYYWLLDKFEKETLEKEEKRKAELKKENEPAAHTVETNSNSAKIESNGSNNSNKTVAADLKPQFSGSMSNASMSNSISAYASPKDAAHEGLLQITFSDEPYTKSWTIYVKPEATDDEAIAEAERVAQVPLTEKMKQAVRSGRQYAYSNLYHENSQPDYEGGYYGEEKITLSLLPDFLRRDDLTEWLFAYQMQDDAEAYDYAVTKYKQTGADIWLMTAISKADAQSAGVKNLLDAAARLSRFAPAYPTVAYHEIRILLEQKREKEAKKLLDEILNSGDDLLPVSSRNQFLEQRNGLAATLDDFLSDALKMPFGFDEDGSTTTSIDELIKQEKSYYNAEYDKETREEYDRKIEDRYEEFKGQAMLDDIAAKIINQHFSTATLLKSIKSPALPEYLKKRFALAVWTRAVLLEDYAAADLILPEIYKLDANAETIFAGYARAKTAAAKRNAALFIILKNEDLSPYIKSGLGSSWEGYLSGASRWWCAPDDSEYDQDAEKDVPLALTDAPKFLTANETAAAQAELKKLKAVGDAPNFLSERVLEWAKRAPADKRIPESLYLVYEADGWDKYGCGNNEEMHDKIGIFLKKRYPQNEWTLKMENEEKDSQ